MANRKISDFYNDRYFEIPKYQRGYAWERKNVRELFEDIFESIDSSSSHYIGTIVLSTIAGRDDSYYIVDGQQRITTLTLIINEIIRHLPEKDADYYKRFYIENEHCKLKPLGKDQYFFIDLLNHQIGTPQNKSQRFMQEVYEEIKSIVSRIADKNGFLKSVQRLEVMEFIENSEGDAIRIFQTVNDRGKSLSNMEKAKSLLIYFSNRYLDKSLDNHINDVFGEIFEGYDDIKHVGESLGINPIKNVDFTEDNIMRYHFVSNFTDNYDATASYVLDFLKSRLTGFRNLDNGNKTKEMSTFITGYIDSLQQFFNSLKSIIEETKHDEKFYKLFCSLSVSATLYPLIVKLKMLDLLEQPLTRTEFGHLTILDLIEIIDVRIYKTRNTDPRAEISRLASEVNENWTSKQVEDRLLAYNQRWMGKEEFLSSLNGNIYGNRALPHIFIEYCEKLEETKYSIDQLKTFLDRSPTIEHVASQTPSYSYEALGFADEKEFLEYQDKLGNLTVIEKAINSSVQNRIPSEKTPQYDRSIFCVTRQLSSEIANKRKFVKEDIEERTRTLVQFCQNRWWC